MSYKVRVVPEELYIINKHLTGLTFVSMYKYIKDSYELRLLDKPSIGHQIYLILLAMYYCP